MQSPLKPLWTRRSVVARTARLTRRWPPVSRRRAWRRRLYSRRQCLRRRRQLRHRSTICRSCLARRGVVVRLRPTAMPRPRLQTAFRLVAPRKPRHPLPPRPMPPRALPNRTRPTTSPRRSSICACCIAPMTRPCWIVCAISLCASRTIPCSAQIQNCPRCCSAREVLIKRRCLCAGPLRIGQMRQHFSCVECPPVDRDHARRRTRFDPNRTQERHVQRILGARRADAPSRAGQC